jgi:Protein of unknown function (DUF2442)
MGKDAVMTLHRVLTTDAEIDAALRDARAREAERPRAIAAHYRRSSDKFVVAFASGATLEIPRKTLQGLESVTPAQAAKVELDEVGSGLHWPALDVDHYIPGILAGIYGTHDWMSTLGRKGGVVRGDAKAAAARVNGRKGGRPRLTAKLGHNPRKRASLIAAKSAHRARR